MPALRHGSPCPSILPGTKVATPRWVKQTVKGNPQEFAVRQKKKPLPRKPASQSPAEAQPRRRNRWEPQVIVPQQVDLPLDQPDKDEVAVPAAPTGRSLANGRL